MENLTDFLKRVSAKAGFTREVYSEGEGEPLVIPMLGDRRHEFALSAYLHHEFKDRYLIVAGLPGRGGLFPAADEYWGLTNEGVAKEIANSAVGWDSRCDKGDWVERQLNKYVETVTPDEFWEFGFKAKFFEKFGFITHHLPGVPVLGTEYRTKVGDRPVILVPNKSVVVSRRNVPVRLTVNRAVYVYLVERLKKEGYDPVVLQGPGTYDISPSVQCAVFGGLKATDELSIVRSGVLVDLFSADRTAMIARSPCVAVAERSTYDGLKDYEADDLMGTKMPHRYIFSFSTMIETNEYVGIIDGILAKLNSLTLDELPSSTATSFAAPYALVRERKAKKFGNRLFRLPKID